jgi:hypothetical protein
MQVFGLPGHVIPKRQGRVVSSRRADPRRDAARGGAPQRPQASPRGGLEGGGRAAPRFTAGNGSPSGAPHGRIVFPARIGRAGWFVRSSGCAGIIRRGVAPSSVRSCGRKALPSPMPPSGGSPGAWRRAGWSTRFRPFVGATSSIRSRPAQECRRSQTDPRQLPKPSPSPVPSQAQGQ